MRIITALVAVAALYSSSALALSTEETGFTIYVLSAMVVKQSCPDYEAVSGGIGKWGDQNGLDVDRLASAITAAMATMTDGEYKRSDLIPEVTRLVSSTAGTLATEATKNKATFCAKWGKLLVDRGFMTKN